jgi:sigma-B regulation protein RsbU (phosphoserine phosphatase)
MPPKTESRLTLCAPHDSAELWRASTWLKEQGAGQSVPAAQLDSLDLLLNEALANVIDHGGPGALAAPIDLSICVTHAPDLGAATVTIADGGSPFNPLDHTPRPLPRTLDEAVPGGLGIPMLRSLADELGYAYDDARNRLSFTVRWAPPAGRAADESAIRLRPFQRNFARPDGARRAPGISWMPLFRGTDEAAVVSVLNECDVLVIAPGTPLLQPGAANDSVFVVLSGDLSARLDSDLNPDTAIPIGPGECIGEMSAIDGKPVTALVIATTEARVLKVTPELFFDRLITVPGVARNLMTALTERMRRTNETMMAAQRKQLALQHLRQELEVAHQLQASMLPLRSPMFPERTDIDIAAIMEPASEVGGDLFDAFFVDDRHLFLCIGDVSGHGIPAALFMARSIGLMRIAAMGTLRPDELITKINDQLCMGNDTDLFVTLFCGFLNVATGRLVYSNGGHCAPILVSGDRACAIPIPKGTLVGAIPGLRYSSLELTLEPDQTLVCYTDGVTEAQPATGEEYSEERLGALLLRQNAASPAAMMDAVRRDVTAFAGSRALDDDYTLMAVRRCATSQPQ